MTVSFHIPPIRTARLILRTFRPEDYPRYLAYYTSDRTAGVGGPRPENEVFERFATMIGHWSLRGFGRYAIAQREAPSDPAFGHVGPMKLAEDEETEMTWTIWDAEHTGHGYATEAARAVLDHLFDQGWSHIAVHIDKSNAASIRVAERLGGELDTETPPPAWNENALRFVIRPNDTP